MCDGAGMKRSCAIPPNFVAFPSLAFYQERELCSFTITPASTATLKTNIRWHLLKHRMCDSVEVECTLQSVLALLECKVFLEM